MYLLKSQICNKYTNKYTVQMFILYISSFIIYKANMTGRAK